MATLDSSNPTAFSTKVPSTSSQCRLYLTSIRTTSSTVAIPRGGSSQIRSSGTFPSRFQRSAKVCGPGDAIVAWLIGGSLAIRSVWPRCHRSSFGYPSRSLGLDVLEEVGEPDGEARQDVATVERLVFADQARSPRRAMDPGGALPWVDHPDQADPGVEVFAQLAPDLRRGVALAEDLNGEVRDQIGDLLLGELAAGELGPRDERQVRGPHQSG